MSLDDGFLKVFDSACLAAWAYDTPARIFWEMCSVFWAFELKWLTDFFLGQSIEK